MSSQNIEQSLNAVVACLSNQKDRRVQFSREVSKEKTFTLYHEGQTEVHQTECRQRPGLQKYC